MNNKEFVKELAQRLGYPNTDTQRMVSLVVDAMSNSFLEGKAVGVLNFGSFEVKKKMERIMVSPTTGQRMLVPPKLVLGFKPNPDWKEKLKKGGKE